MIRVWVAAAPLAARIGLRAMLSLEGEIEVCGESASLAAGLPGEVDVLVLDADLLPALDVSGEANGSYSRPVLLLASRDDPATLARLRLPQTPWGLLPFDSSPEELRAAIHALQQGLIVAAPPLLQRIVSVAPQQAVDDDEPLIEPLTERESEVLQRLAYGLANKQIAVDLGISEHTVKFHISAIYGKLQVTNRTEAVRSGVRKGLIAL